MLAPPLAARCDTVESTELAKVQIVEDDNLRWLRTQTDASYSLIYIDPPFNTGIVQQRRRVKVERDPLGARIGFGDRRYVSRVLDAPTYRDQFDDYMAFLSPRLREAHRLLETNGSLFVHLDHREVHYVKVYLDGIFGRKSFMNEIIWAYDYGARSRRRWSTKHDTILWYAKNPHHYTYRFEAIDRIPYLAPKLVGPEKAKRGKTPTDVWWATIVSPTGREKTGYPTQKPLSILRRIVRVHSEPNDRLLDFFAGSGSFGEAALLESRSVTLVDQSRDAIAVMQKRLAPYGPSVIRNNEPTLSANPPARATIDSAHTGMICIDPPESETCTHRS